MFNERLMWLTRGRYCYNFGGSPTTTDTNTTTNTSNTSNTSTTNQQAVGGGSGSQNVQLFSSGNTVQLQDANAMALLGQALGAYSSQTSTLTQKALGLAETNTASGSQQFSSLSVKLALIAGAAFLAYFLFWKGK